jgi:hypothetical protein
MLHYFKRMRDGVEALPRNWVECDNFGLFALHRSTPVNWSSILVR